MYINVLIHYELVDIHVMFKILYYIVILNSNQFQIVCVLQDRITGHFISRNTYILINIEIFGCSGSDYDTDIKACCLYTICYYTFLRDVHTITSSATCVYLRKSHDHIKCSLRGVIHHNHADVGVETPEEIAFAGSKINKVIGFSSHERCPTVTGFINID